MEMKVFRSRRPKRLPAIVKPNELQVSHAAEILGVHRQRIWYFIRMKRLRARKTCYMRKRIYLVSKEDVFRLRDQLIARRRNYWFGDQRRRARLARERFIERRSA